MRRVAAILCAAAAFRACGGWVTGGVREPVRAPEWRVGGCLAGDGYARWTLDGVRVVNTAVRSPLVAWYTCDDDAASRVILDSTAEAGHGLMLDADTDARTVEGVVGGALWFACGGFDGEHVSVTGAAACATFSGDAWTLAFWAKREGSEHLTLARWMNSLGGTVGEIYWNKDVVQLVGYVPGSAGSVGEPCVLPGSGNTWSHFCFVRSGASWSAYVNGGLLQGFPAAGTPEVTLFDFGNSDAWLYEGKTLKDEVRVYDVALSTAEVASLYAGYPEPPAPPSVVVTFDPNGGTIPEGQMTSKTVTAGDYYYDLPAPENGGAYFGGWYTDSWEYVDYWTTVTRTTSHTLYAMWW